MPHPFYMAITGVSQGEFQGDCPMEAHQNKTLCQGLKHNITVICEEGSGMPTGHRRHGKLTIFKVIDRITPLLANALCSNEQLEVSLEFYRANPIGDGTEEHFFTIRLDEARCVDLEHDIPNCLDTDNDGIQNMEYVSFAYGSIRWTYEPDGIEHEDHWCLDANS
jgi:type VI secretion system secreted protein Hcp